MGEAMKKKLVSGLFYLIDVAPVFIGANLFLYLMGKIPVLEGESAKAFDYILNNSIMIAMLLLTYLLMKWRRKRKGEVPTFDERTLKIMKDYFLWVIYIVFILSSLILLVLFFSGVETIEIGMIFVYLTVLMTCIGIGALIASRAESRFSSRKLIFRPFMSCLV